MEGGMRGFGWFVALMAMMLSASAALADSTQEVVNKEPHGLALTPPMGWNSWNKFA
jgi:alpha-galactosidase